MDPQPDSRPMVLRAFEERYRADERAGGAAPLLSYVAMWPGHELGIARAWLAMGRHERTSTAAATLDDDGRLGPYELEAELGRGGQGMVYRAVDTRLQRTVALKVLTALGPTPEGQLARFRREAEVASRLQHPSICAIHESGVQDGIPYIAMRHVDGETLAARIDAATESVSAGASAFLDLASPHARPDTRGEVEAAGPSSAMKRSQLDATLTFFEKVARALQTAHEAGVLHRDIKPANIMVDVQGEPVILDFGLARDEHEELRTLTQTGDLFGTPAYMSPEQVAGQQIRLDARSDVYSLGVTLFECLTLSRPFDAPSREGLYQAVMTHEPPDPRRWNRAIPTDLKVVVETALEKDRDRRYRSARALAEDLAAVRERRPIAARPLSPLGRAARFVRRHPVRATLLLMLLLGLPVITSLSSYVWAKLPSIRAQEQVRLAERVEGWLDLGFHELHLDAPRQAVAHFEEALALDPTAAEAAAGMSMALLQLDRPEPALEALDEVAGRIERPAILEGLRADVLTALDRSEEAAAALERRPEPRDARSWFLEGLREMHAGRAIVLARGWKAERSTSVQAHFTAAEAHFTRAVRSSPEARRTYQFRMAHAAGLRAQRARGGPLADAMVALWEASDDARYWAAFSIGIRPRVVALLEELTSDRPNHAAAWLRLADIQHRLGRHAEALQAYEQVAQLRPQSAKAHFARGALLLDSGATEAAEAAYRRALAVLTRADGRKLETLAAMARLLERDGNMEQAETQLREVLSAAPNDVDHAVALGTLLARQGRREEALELLRPATEGDGEAAVAALEQVIGIHLAEDRLEVAIKLARSATARHPKAASLERMRARAQVRRGKESRAIRSYRRALELDPQDSESHCELGHLMVKQDMSLERALEHLRRGHVVGRTRGSLWDLPSAKWMDEAVVARATELSVDGDAEGALELLEGYLQFFPELGAARAERDRLKGAR